MAILYYLGFLATAAVAFVIAAASLFEPAGPPTRVAPKQIAAISAPKVPATPVELAPAERAPALAPDPRTGHWGPRVAPGGSRSDDAPAGVAQAARQRALAEAGHDRPARARLRLPEAIVGRNDEPAPETLGYAPPSSPGDRFRIY